VAVLANILRLESGRPELISLAVPMLSVIAHHENIRKEFEVSETCFGRSPFCFSSFFLFGHVRVARVVFSLLCRFVT
jgi:hypothetical protein